MERADKGLAFMMQYENVAWYDGGEVRILDRRVYPRRVEFVTCRTHREVAQALTDMVTQSTGPFTAAAMGMALAAWECRDRTAEQQVAYLEQAMDTISHARPTTVGRMQLICGGCLEVAKAAIAQDVPDVALAIRDYTVATNNRRYSRVGQMAKHLVDKFPDSGTVMTQCFGETIVAMMLKECRERGKSIRLFCPETRPYFQGARLTATVCHDMGFDVTVITDNMPAYVMQQEHVDVFTCAADAICCDGYIANKVGTFQISIAANYLGVPVYISGIPDKGHPTVDTVHIEMRNPQDTLEAMGVKTAADGVKGYYPAFDITPPQLITGVVTDLGIYSPYELKKYLEVSELGPYEMVV
jgi:methylthioribose-1-phosphate isomerase